MPSINMRIAALAEILEREKRMEELELDNLSLSLYELEKQLSDFTEADIADMASEVDEGGRQILTPEQAHAFVDEWRQRRAERTPRQQQKIDRAIEKKKRIMEERRR